MKVAISVIGRLENRYAIEFVEYYKNLGIDHIYIGDNNYDGEEYFENKIIDYIKQSNDNYILFNDNTYKNYGSAMYGIMNRDIMKLYLDSQHKKFVQSDWVDHFYNNVDINRYLPKHCMFVDQFTYEKVFINYDRSFAICWNNLYLNLYKNLIKDNFFMPNIFNTKSIYYSTQN